MAPLVVMRALVALVASAVLRAHRAPTLRRWSAALAAAAVTPVRRALARRAPVAWMEQPCRAMVALAVRVARAERAAIAVRAALAAVVLPGRAPMVVWVSRAPAALAAVVALVARGSMRAASLMAQLVGMPGLVAPVEQVELRARLAPTLRRWSAVLAGLAVTLAWRARARRV
jgi:hypothetical protein